MASSFCQCQNPKSGGRTVSSLAFFCIQADTTPRQLYLVTALKCEMKCISFIFLFCLLCYFLGTGSHQFWSEVLHMLTLILHPFIVCSLHCSWDSLLKCKSGHVTSCWRILPWPPHDFWNKLISWVSLTRSFMSRPLIPQTHFYVPEPHCSLYSSPTQHPKVPCTLLIL